MKILTDIQRVLRVASKPTPTEYRSSFKMTGIGLLILGTIGFSMFLIFQFLY